MPRQPKEDRKAEIEKLEYPGENHGIVGQGVPLEIDASGFSVVKTDEQALESVGVLVFLVTDGLEFAGVEPPPLVPTKALRRFPQQRDYFLAGHARPDRVQILFAQLFLALSRDVAVSYP